VRLFCAVLALGAGLLPEIRQEPPLPEPTEFLRATRDHLRDDWRLASSYTYLERRTEYRPGPNGRDEPSSIKLFQVYPGSDPGRAYRRLIEVNGKPVPREEIERADREHEKRVLERQRARDTESASERASRLKKEQERRQDEQAIWDDLMRVYTFTLTGRDVVDGRSLIVVRFEPRPNANPTTDIGERMVNVKGRAWISETDYQVARIDAEVLDDISFGWGILGKLYAGAKGSYVRRKVNDELWLPLRLQYTGSGRALIKRFNVNTVIEYSDYKRVSPARVPRVPDVP